MAGSLNSAPYMSFVRGTHRGASAEASTDTSELFYQLIKPNVWAELSFC